MRLAREKCGGRIPRLGAWDYGYRRSSIVAANFIARYIERYRWIAYVGLAVIVYVAGKMIYDGIVDPHVGVSVLFA